MSMTPQIYLASASPRRAELLRQIGIGFERCSVDIDEQRRSAEPAYDYVCRLAIDKAAAAKRLIGSNSRPVLGADTIVVIDGDILGKPASRMQARQMLARLSNNWHEVLTAVAMISEGVDRFNAQCEHACSVTRVHMRPLSAEEIASYGAQEAVLDKAGGYAIQGLAASFIDRIEGSYSGVMGLPLYETSELLKQFGINVLACKQEDK